MNDRPLILAGLVVFLAVATLPVWYNVAAGTRPEPPAVARPSGERACVAPTAFMRTSHAALLVSWRDEVVRHGERTWTAHDGRQHRKALTATCLGCHRSKKDFCDRCHDYAGVQPSCTDCHVVPGGETRR